MDDLNTEINLHQHDEAIDNVVSKIEPAAIETAAKEIISGEATNILETTGRDDTSDDTTVTKDEYSDIEKEALKKGWKPSHLFEGNSQDFRSAREYIERSEILHKLSHQNQNVKKLTDTVQELLKVNKNQQDMISKERADYYLQQKREAINNGNVDDAEKFERAYYESQIHNNYQQKDKDVNPSALEFARRNINWFNDENPEMKEFAIKKEEYLSRLFPDWSDEKRLAETEKAVKEFYPNKFGNVNRETPPAINITSSENLSLKKSKRKITFAQLPSAYKTVVRQMANYGDLNLDDYAQQLYDSGVVKNG